jgi:predicted RNase H-like HicB family nuclease
MFAEYIKAAMKTAHYEHWEDEKMFYGEIPACRGVLATGDTLEACRAELEEVLEGWLLLSIHDHDTIPVIDGVSLEIKQVA